MTNPNRLVPAVLALVLAGLVSAIVLVDRDRRDHWFAIWDDGDHWSDAGLAVAEQETIHFFDLDHRRIEDDVEQVLSLATGDFASDYADKRDELVASVEEKEAVWTASIPDGGTAVEYVERDEASVLVAVEVEKSVRGAAPTTERSRVRLLLAYGAGEWLVSDFQEVG